MLGSQVQKWTQMQMLLHMWMMNWEANQQGTQDTDHQSAAAVFFRSVSSREREKLTFHFACKKAYQM